MNEIQSYVREKLLEVEQTECCRILLAVESGSRAWGFPSTDSDFDVRFIYLRPRDWYLTIDEGRDVIERPLDEKLVDLSGWDLKKSLKLLRKSNPPLLEWLQSPLIYLEQTAVPAGLRDLMTRLYSPQACMYHYLHMAQGNYHAYLRGDQVKLKKYFYAFRPVLACRWIESGAGPVPMEYSKLVDAVLPDGAVKTELAGLLEAKRQGVELELGPRRDSLNAFLEREIERLGKVHFPKGDSSAATALLNEFFRESLADFEGAKP